MNCKVKPSTPLMMKRASSARGMALIEKIITLMCLIVKARNKPKAIRNRSGEVSEMPAKVRVVALQSSGNINSALLQFYASSWCKEMEIVSQRLFQAQKAPESIGSLDFYIKTSKSSPELNIMTTTSHFREVLCSYIIVWSWLSLRAFCSARNEDAVPIFTKFSNN